jgi:PmbA protein
MKKTIELLQLNQDVSDYKINIHKKESCELFFVKGKLETMRRTNTCDKEVTVYVQHGQYKGDSQFFIYPSTTDQQIEELIRDAVAKAKLIQNIDYRLPGGETGEYEVESNFASYDPVDLAAQISKAVFDANTVENAALNSVEVFINKHTETILNSRGLRKTQVRYDAMVEAIPTYNGTAESVELYEQYNFSSFSPEEIRLEIAGKMIEVKARYEAVKPDFAMDCKVILGAQELAQLFINIARDLNYATVYSQSNLFKKGDAIQKEPSGDRISITMTGQIPGSVRNSRFDSDGVSLGSIQLVDNGTAVNYYGSNRFGQYLNEMPTGSLPCLDASVGTAPAADFCTGPYLQIVSMSGLQVDFYSDYIGGEIRLAYYHDGSKLLPVTGISISGSLSQVLSDIRLSTAAITYNGYHGPDKAILSSIRIF